MRSITNVTNLQQFDQNCNFPEDPGQSRTLHDASAPADANSKFHYIIRKKFLAAAMTALLFALFFSFSAWAGTVKASGKRDSTDFNRIVAELKKTKSVKLVSGKTYYLSGTIYVESGWTIDATGATVICASSAVRNVPRSYGYNSVQNIKIKGGTWRYKSASGFATSSFQFSHASNINFENMTLQCTNYKGHAIELIACQYVNILNCKIYAQGSCPANCHEEMIQIDVAAPSCNRNKAYNNGRCCHNITIQGCTVTGARGVCANYARADGGSYLNHYHSNIVIRNSRISSRTGEAVALFNTISGEVSRSFITNNLGARDVSSAYTVGLHYALFGVLKTGNITIKNNVIKGGRQSLLIYSHTSASYGTVTLYNNWLYCKKGKQYALGTGKIKKLIKTKVSLRQW